jgi:hypothetical protein
MASNSGREGIQAGRESEGRVETLITMALTTECECKEIRPGGRTSILH